MRSGSKKIGLLDHMGGGNLGDDTTQTAVIHNIRKRWPTCTIYGFSMNPEDTRSRHAIPAYAIRREQWDNSDRTKSGKPDVTPPRRNPLSRFLRRLASLAIRKPATVASELVFLTRSFRVLRTLDILVISGGGQLLDSWGGCWNYPYTIFKWVSLAKLAGTKCYFVNVGAGPLQHPFSRFLIRRALRSADYVSFRDHKSKALMRKFGFSGEAGVFPDCAYGLEVPSPVRSGSGTRNAPLVGMSPMAYCDPRRYWIQDLAAYEDFKRKFTAFGSWLSKDYCVTLFSTDIWFDRDTLDDVRLALASDPSVTGTRLLIREPITGLDTLLSQMSSMDYIITCRFHGVIFAHLMNVPVIAISHHPKVTTLMTDLGLSEYCLDIDTFDPPLLTSTFSRMASDSAGIKARMADKAKLYKEELARQFDQLFVPEPS